VRVTNKFLSSICVDCLEKGHGKIPWPSVLSHQAKDQMEAIPKTEPKLKPATQLVSFYGFGLASRQLPPAEVRLISTLFSSDGFSFCPSLLFFSSGSRSSAWLTN